MVQTKNAVIYARVSTNDQDCTRQINDLQVFAEKAGYSIIQVFTEKASGMKLDRHERAKVMSLAQSRKIDAVLVTEVSRWGRSTEDLLSTLRQLAAWKVSVIAMDGLQLDLSTTTGELMVGMLSLIAQFERNLIRDRVKSGLASAKLRGKKLGRQPGQNPSDKYAKKVLKLVSEGRSYRWIAHELQISKTTVTSIIKRTGAAVPPMPKLQ